MISFRLTHVRANFAVSFVHTHSLLFQIVVAFSFHKMCENRNEIERGLADNEETQEIWVVSESFVDPYNRPMKIFRSKQFAEQYMKEFYVEYLEIAAYRLRDDSNYLKMFTARIGEAGETVYFLNETLKAL